jgi:CHAD domain-containing protein
MIVHVRFVAFPRQPNYYSSGEPGFRQLEPHPRCAALVDVGEEWHRVCSGDLMSFELHHRKHLEDELTKIVRRELRKTVRALTTSDGTTVGVIHESRKRVKKVRAVAVFLEQAGAKLPRKDRKRLKSAARALSSLRDSAAIIASLDRVRRRYPKQLPEHTYGILRRSLVGVRKRQEARAKRDGVVAGAAERLAKTRRSAKEWTSPSIGVSDIVAIMTASYRRSRKAMRRSRATGQSATLHRWRKELKTLWYQLRLAKPLTSGVAPLIADLKRLETELGDDHNLVVLGATLRGCRELRTMRAQLRQIERLAARMRQPLRRRAFALGRRVHARKPKAFARWIGTSMKPRPRQTAAA